MSTCRSRPTLRLRGLRLLAAAWAFGAALAAAQDEADGRALFVSYGCYQCHGYEGQGGAAARIAPSAYSLEAFTVFVRRPANEMPAYARAVLNDEQLAAIYRYVRSIPEPPPVVGSSGG